MTTIRDDRRNLYSSLHATLILFPSRAILTFPISRNSCTAYRTVYLTSTVDYLSTAIFVNEAKFQRGIILRDITSLKEKKKKKKKKKIVFVA